MNSKLFLHFIFIFFYLFFYLLLAGSRLYCIGSLQIENMKSDEKLVSHVQHRVRIAVIGKADVGKSGKNLQEQQKHNQN